MEEPSRLDDLLRAAFEDEPREGESVLEAIERMSGTQARVLLREAPDPETPVLRAQDGRSPDLARGDRRYRISGEIARGGIGVVLKGRDRSLGRSVALKVLRAEHVGNAEILRRFIEEAQIGGQLQHPGIVPVYGLGLESEGRPYFAMKLVKGETLSARIEDRADPKDGRRRFLGIFEQVAQTVAYAHARGVVHRDLKPSNVMIGNFGEVQVVDWGLAKVMGRGESESPPATIITTVRTEGEGSASLVGSVMGTPAYMPPEQALGHVGELDERSDVFALGAILTEILTGRPPYLGDAKDQIVQAAQARLSDAFARLDGCGAEEAVIGLAKRCLAAVPGERPRDAGVVAKEVGEILAAAEARAREAEIGAAEDRARAEEERESAARERHRVLRERAARRRTVAVAAAALVFVLAAGGGFLLKTDADRRRRSRAGFDVATAMRAAEEHFGAKDWPRALVDARRAVAVAEARGADGDTARRAAALLALVGERKRVADETARRVAEDDALVARLEDIRIRRMLDFDSQRTVQEYAGAFRDHGIDVEGLPPGEAGRRILARTRPGPLAAAIDDWAALHLFKADLPAAGAERLFAVARAADPDPWRNRVRDALLAQDVDELRRLAKTADLDGLPARSLDMLGLALGNLDVEAGAAFLRQAQLRHPADLWINHHLQPQLMKAKEPDAAGALRYATAVLAIAPGWANAWRSFAARLHLAKRYDESLEAYARAMAIDPDNGLLLGNYAYLLLELGRMDEAAAAARRAVELEPGEGNLWNTHAVLLEKQGRLDDAIEAWRKAAALDPRGIEILTNLTIALSSRGEVDEALATFREGMTAVPDRANAHARLGGLLRKLGRHEESALAYRAAVEAAPEDTRYRVQLGISLFNLEKHDEAIETFREVLRVEPQNAFAGPWITHALVSAGRVEEAKTHAREAIASDPENAVHHAALARLHLVLGEHEAAVAPYRRAVELDPVNVNYLNALGALLTDNLGRYEEALEMFRALSELIPGSPRPWHNIGLTLQKTGKLDEAAAAFRRSVELERRYFRGWDGLAMTHVARKAWDEAAEAFLEAAAVAPREDLRDQCRTAAARALLEHGNTTHARGDHEAEIAAIRRARTLLEDDPDVLNHLAWVLVTCAERTPANLEEGLRLAERAVELAPGNADGLSTLGVALYRTGSFEAAADRLRQALEKRGDGPEAGLERLLLAMALYRSGHEEEGRRELAAARALLDERPSGHPDAERFQAEAEALIEGGK